MDVTHLEFDCSDEKATALLRAARLFDEGKELVPLQRSQWKLYCHNPKRVTVDGYVVCPECKHGFDRIKGTWFKRCPECGAIMNIQEDAQ